MSEIPGFETQKYVSDIVVGQRLTDKHGDRYLVTEELGKGGMGAVYKIKQERTELDRALKIIRPSWFNRMPQKDRDGAVKRFHKEISAVAHLQNPFILPAVDVIEFDLNGEHTIGFVTELVEGTNLEDEIKKETFGLNPELAVEFAGEIAMALVSLDEVGLVHRDLKPANIFLEHMPNGKKFVRVGDFGLVASAEDIQIERTLDNLLDSHSGKPKSEAYFAELQRILSKKGERITEQGMVVGTPNFMAPEQIQGEPATHQSDLYALGVILYEMISREPIFVGRNYLDLAVQHLNAIPPSFKGIGIENVPAWLEAIIMKLLQKKPEDRFASAKEVFVALKEGVKKDYPKLMNEEPFMYNVGSDIDASKFAIAA